MNPFNAFMASRSWKSSSLGIAVILLGFVWPLYDGAILTRERIAIGLAGIALCFVRDNDRTSEDVGVKPKENDQ